MYAKPFKCESQTQSCFNFLGAYWLSRGQYTQFSYFSINIQQGILYCDCGECVSGSVTGTYIHMTLLLFTAHIYRNMHTSIHSMNSVVAVTFCSHRSVWKAELTSAVCPALQLLCPPMFHTIKWGASAFLSCFISCKKKTNILQRAENYKCSTQVVFSFLKNWIIFPMKPCCRCAPPPSLASHLFWRAWSMRAANSPLKK